MSRQVRVISEYATTVIRLFPDHAGSVIWFADPVPYEQTGLDEALVADLVAWDCAYEAGLTDDHAWRSAESEVAFHAQGSRLARRLADQVGEDFQVEYDGNGSRLRFRGPGTALGPAAAAAFQRLAAAARVEWADVCRAAEAARRRGSSLEWRA